MGNKRNVIAKKSFLKLEDEVTHIFQKVQQKKEGNGKMREKNFRLDLKLSLKEKRKKKRE